MPLTHYKSVIDTKRRSYRSLRIGHEIQKALARYIDIELCIPITITSVKLDRDLKEAVVLFSVFLKEECVKSISKLCIGSKFNPKDNDQYFIFFLNSIVPKFKRQLANKLKLRRIPRLMFKYDYDY
jgi:ribosome-binding factor A